LRGKKESGGGENVLFAPIAGKKSPDGTNFGRKEKKERGEGKSASFGLGEKTGRKATPSCTARMPGRKP